MQMPAPVAALRVEDLAPLPSKVDPAVTNKKEALRKRAIAAKGMSSTILTGPQGLMEEQKKKGTLIA